MKTGMLDEDNPIQPKFRHRYDVSHVTTARFVVSHGEKGWLDGEFIVIDTQHPVYVGGMVVKTYGTLARASRYVGFRNGLYECMLHASRGMRRLGVAQDAHEAEPLDGWDEVAFVRCVV